MDYYDNHNNSQEGGRIMRKKIKMVEYENKVAYEFNNIDKEKLTEESEFPIASISKIFIIVYLGFRVNNYIIKFLTIEIFPSRSYD